jgi:hypothetical protein
MKNKIALMLVILFAHVIVNAQGRYVNTKKSVSNETTKSFAGITKNKTWIVSKYVVSSNQEEKKAQLSRIVLKFTLADSCKFYVEGVGTDKMIGQWIIQNENQILFSLPLINTEPISNNDLLYNEAAIMLSGWPLQTIEMQPTLLKFKMIDPTRGAIIIELSEKK